MQPICLSESVNSENINFLSCPHFRVVSPKFRDSAYTFHSVLGTEWMTLLIILIQPAVMTFMHYRLYSVGEFILKFLFIVPIIVRQGREFTIIVDSRKFDLLKISGSYTFSDHCDLFCALTKRFHVRARSSTHYIYCRS